MPISTARPADQGATRLRGRRLGTLPAVLLGFLVVPLAMTGTSVALPLIAVDLDSGGAALQWVVTGYFLAASSCMLVAGSLGDLVGRRRVLRVGAGLYAISTLAAALVDDIVLLDLARTFAGIGAAAILAGGGAIIGATFAGAARTTAFAAVGSTVGVGLAFGPAVSGLLVSVLGWRTMFVVFAAASAVTLVGSLAVRESRAARPPRFDLVGSLLVVAGLALLMYGITRSVDVGWTDRGVQAPVVTGLVLLGAFVVVQRRADHPVLDLGLLDNRTFVGWLVASVLLAGGTVGVLVYLPTYLQGAAGLSTRLAGLTMLAMTTPVLILPLLVARLVNRGLPARVVAISALCLVAFGNLVLSGLEASPGAGTLLGLFCLGVGNGVVVGLVDAQAINQVPAHQVGMASGAVNFVRSAANTVALALFGTALVGLLQSAVGGREPAGRIATGVLPHDDRDVVVEHLTNAWQVTLIGVTGLCAAGTIAVLLLLNRRPPGRTAPATTKE
jgi:MFS family permease